MDFSSVRRALESLQRRQPPLPDDCLAVVNRVSRGLGLSAAAAAAPAAEGENLVSSLRELLTTEYVTTTTMTGDTNNNEPSKKIRWEPLAVALFVSTELLQQQQQTQSEEPTSSSTATTAATVYMDGPRVPVMAATATADLPLPHLSSSDPHQAQALCPTLHAVCLRHLEHAEPRVRTLVAKAVGAYCQYGVEPDHAREMHERLVHSIRTHIVEGRVSAVAAATSSTTSSSAAPKDYSKDSTGALDDTTGWRALETSWLCLAAMIAALQGRYCDLFPLHDNDTNSSSTTTTAMLLQLLQDCQHSSVTHRNRHVRAAAMQTLEQWVRAVAAAPHPDAATVLQSPTSPFRQTVIAVLQAGLADNWSQVRMAASVLCRVWFTALKEQISCSSSSSEDSILDDSILQANDLMAPLLPRMCLNRFYLAQGVKLYSHETWVLLFQQPGSGVHAVATHLGAVVRYYTQMCDADNHVVREGACQAIAELAVRLGSDNDEHQYHDVLEQHMPVLLQALIMCFHDESWPVRDEACLACGILCKAYPELCQPEFNTLWERWTEQLTDQIWSVREDAAVALGDAMEAYGTPVQEKIRTLLQQILPSARQQPRMTAAEYRAHVNDVEQHSNTQLYSCGSLAPKLSKKAGAGRVGCSNCGIDRPKAPWEATDGAIYLIREYAVRGTANGTVTDDELVPLLRELVDVCRVQHFPQSDDLRATLWRTVPGLAQALGKQRFKSQYLEIFLELLFHNLESRTASALSKHAAGQCAEELAQLVGVAIFRARLEDYQRDVYDQVMRERQMMPKGPGAGDVFSPFGPPGLLDGIRPQHS